MRKPDVVIGGKDDPYLLRWWIIPRNRWFNIYLHKFLRSDDDRALHDHPAWNISLPLSGGYWEFQFAEPDLWPVDKSERVFWRRRWLPVFRTAKTAHRIQLRCRHPQLRGDPVWTLWISGPKLRDWGFWCPKGWRRWEDFCDPADPGMRGPGCD